MRILVVEDETKMARAMMRGLENEGYSVDRVATGDDAYFWATEQEYDAIILDVMLPGRDGFSVCKDLRAQNVWSPVLMLTARGGVEDRIAGLDCGADDYMVKPFAFGELLARLRALLRRGPTERAPTLQVGDLSVDPAAHTVERAGVRLDLSPKEFALLEYLMRHEGEVVTRTQILDHVWDYNYGGGSNVVDVYVGYLRKKVEKPFKSPLIQAVRGVGYKIEAS